MLAKKAGLKVETLRALEQGGRQSRPATVRDVAEALEVTPEEIRDLAAEIAAKATPLEAPSLPTDIEQHRLFRLLAERSRFTVNRANLVRGESGELSPVTLAGGLYVEREIEEEVLRVMESSGEERNLVVLEGEPGTGKSTLLWSLHGQLTATTNNVVWLLDAIELPSIFGHGAQEGGVLSPEFRLFFERLVAAARQPIVLIDTADVALNTKGRDDHLLSLMTELTVAGVRILAASRPGEARKLSAFGPRGMRIADYSDDEFKAAVLAYARVFVGDGAELDAEAQASALMNAAAQGYPVKEICRNPLTLRMLYSVYAPQDINALDVDVISLYREFWRRRVRADIRTDAASAPASDRDLSGSAMHIGIAMLVEGLPELPAQLLESELGSAGREGDDLDVLEARGVVRTFSVGVDKVVSFFHQTFFEHAAALGILRLGRERGLRALAERWASFDGNLFLGATLERALILAEHEPLPVRDAAEKILENLVDRGGAGSSILTYVYVHRGSSSEVVDGRIEKLVKAGDPLITERLLELGGNAPRQRRAALIDVLGRVLDGSNSRWIRRALELLMRFSAPDIAPVAKIIQDRRLDVAFIEGSKRLPQARDIYFRFLNQFLPQDWEWALDQLARLFVDCLQRRADETALQIIGSLSPHSAAHPKLATAFEQKTGILEHEGEPLLTSEEVARAYGDLFRVEWKAQRLTPAEVFALLQQHGVRGLALTARLNGFASMLVESDSEEILEAFELSGQVGDPTVRAMLARITWTIVLPRLASTADPGTARALFGKIRAQAGEIFVANRSALGEIVFHVASHGPISKNFTGLLLGEASLSDRDLWLDTHLLGRRLVEGHLAGIAGAKMAMDLVAAAPDWNKLLTRAMLAQLRHAERPSELTALGMTLALNTRNDDAALAFLRDEPAPRDDWKQYADGLRRMAGRVRSFGNEKARRQAAAIELELVRLKLDPSLDWKTIVARLEHETDDSSHALLIEALGFIIRDVSSAIVSRTERLMAFAAANGLKARKAVLDVIAKLSEDHPEIPVKFIDKLFALAFAKETDGNAIAKLSTPLYVLYKRKDARLPALAEELVERCAPLPTQACRLACATLRHLFALIMRRMDQDAKGRLFRKIPGLDRSLARMIIQGGAESDTREFSAKLQAIAENPKTAPDIITLAQRFLRRELRVSGLERWPELYNLVALV